MNGLSAFSSLSADPGQSSLFPVESSLCQPKAFNITFISQIKNLKPRKDNDVQKASLQILAKDLEIFQNTRCRGALGAHSLELLIDSLKVCYSPDSLYFQGVQAMWEKSTGKVTRVAGATTRVSPGWEGECGKDTRKCPASSKGLFSNRDSPGIFRPMKNSSVAVRTNHGGSCWKVLKTTTHSGSPA